MQLTKNFSLNELVISKTALANHIGNMPNDEQLANLLYLCEALLQPVRDKINMPIRVNSGFRSLSLNFKIGGAKYSQHLDGEAVDITCADNALLFNILKDNFEFDQLIWEHGDESMPAWVHVSLTRGNNRNQILRAYKSNQGGTIYEKF